MARSSASADVVFTPNQPSHEPKKEIRFVRVGGVVYLRAEDVADFITELGATEETDVRTRLEAAAHNIKQSNPTLT